MKTEQQVRQFYLEDNRRAHDLKKAMSTDPDAYTDSYLLSLIQYQPDLLRTCIIIDRSKLTHLLGLD